MSFDPDAYLEEFSPDDYLAEMGASAPPARATSTCAACGALGHNRTSCSVRLAAESAGDPNAGDLSLVTGDKGPGRGKGVCSLCQKPGHRRPTCPMQGQEDLLLEERRSLIWARAEAMRRRAAGIPDPPPRAPAPANDVAPPPPSTMLADLRDLTDADLDDLGGWAWKAQPVPAIAPPAPPAEPEADPPPPIRDHVVEPDVGKPLHLTSDGRARSRTISPSALLRTVRKARRQALAGIPDAEVDGSALGPEIPRPATRGDCIDGANGDRPCPWVSCHHHLYLDANPLSGAIKLNFPQLEVWEMAETCCLDVADRGGITLEQTGAILNLTRERIRQVEQRGMETIKGATGFELDLPPDTDRDPLEGVG